MNCGSFLRGRAHRASEWQSVSRARFTATGGQTSFCLEGVNLPALPTRQARPCINTHGGRLAPSHNNSQLLLPTALTDGLPRGRRIGGRRRRRGRRCLSSPRCPAEAPTGPRTRSRTGSRSSSCGVNVCRKASCLRIQTSPPPTPRSSSARVFL